LLSKPLPKLFKIGQTEFENAVFDLFKFGHWFAL
jgi:hypothetical protein